MSRRGLELKFYGRRVTDLGVAEAVEIAYEKVSYKVDELKT